MKPNVHAGRLERRVRRVGRETMPGIHGFCSLPWFTADCRLRSESALRVNKGRNRSKPSSSNQCRCCLTVRNAAGLLPCFEPCRFFAFDLETHHTKAQQHHRPFFWFWSWSDTHGVTVPVFVGFVGKGDGFIRP